MDRSILKNPWFYLGCTVLWTWLFFGVTFLVGVSGESPGLLGPLLVLTSLAGPTVVALFFIQMQKDPKAKKDFWVRVYDWKRISFPWALTILFLMPLVTLVALFISGDLEHYTFGSMIGSVPFTLLIIVIVPTLEELGWRGYALDLLQKKYSALTSALILGFVWSLWHLPAFFLSEGGGALTKMGIGSLPFYMYFTNIIIVCFVINWIYNNTKRSTLAAILVHIVIEFLCNFGLWNWYSESVIYYTVVLFLLVVGIICFSDPKTLIFKKKSI